MTNKKWNESTTSHMLTKASLIKLKKKQKYFYTYVVYRYGKCVIGNTRKHENCLIFVVTTEFQKILQAH